MTSELQQRLQARNIGYQIAAAQDVIALRRQTPDQDLRELLILSEFAFAVSPGRDAVDDAYDRDWMLRRLTTKRRA